MTHNYIDGVLTITNDEGGIIRFPYNTETQLPFESEDEAVSYAYNHPLYFTLPQTLDELKAGVILRIKEEFVTNSINIVIDSSLGFPIDADREDLNNFIIAKKHNSTTVRAADNTFHTVTSIDLDTIISEIELHGLSLYQTKWDKENQVLACTTEEELTALGY